VRLSLASGAPIIPLGIFVPERDTLKIGHLGNFQSPRWQFRGKFNVRPVSAWTLGQERDCQQEQFDIQEITCRLMDKIYSIVQQAV
jgi:hypothetical protein